MKKIVFALIISAFFANTASAQTVKITPQAVALAKKLGMHPTASKDGKLILTFIQKTPLTCDPDKTKELHDKVSFWDKYGMHAFTITIPEHFELVLDSVQECKAENGTLVIRRAQETWFLVDRNKDGDGGHIIKDGTDVTTKDYTPYTLLDHVIAYAKTQMKGETSE